jgi:putative membrane-bound dehydrogenase-like protein
MKIRFFVGLVGAMMAAKAFAGGVQLTGQHAPASTPALPPEEAQKKFVVPKGFEVRLFAAEPDVINPVAMAWDERGRLWVLELYEYPDGAPPGHKGRDRIKILEDTHGDGRADKVTVFADGLNLATGLLLGNGGVYVGQAPDLLFLTDTHHDDVADTRTTLLTGFGRQDRHELLNGFTWGPDGWLYMTQGVFTHSVVKAPDLPWPGVEMTAGVARYDPISKKFEVYGDGTSNPWGVDFDRAGNAFVSACVIDHLFHIAPGGIYERQGGLPVNPYAYELLPSIVNFRHYMAAYCGVCVYQGSQFPEEYRGAVFMGNIHQHAINHDRLSPNGSSFKASAQPDFLTTDDGWFMPVSEQVGPDGALWIADWYDKYPCYQNAQADPAGVDRERGRIWRVVYTGGESNQPPGEQKHPSMNLAALSNSALVKLLEHPNEWQRRTAQRLLDERETGANGADAETEKALERLLSQGMTIESRLAALRILNRCWPINAALLHQCMTDHDPAMRATAARIVGERDLTTEEARGWLEDLAGDPDPGVRLAVATAARQLVSGDLTVDTPPRTEGVRVAGILTTLIRSSADAKDPLLPFMIWMAGEPGLARNPGPGLAWLAENGPATMPLSGILAAKAMRRICENGDEDRINMTVKFLDAVADQSPALAAAALDGLLEAQKGKPIPPTEDTKPLFAKLNASSDPELAARARRLGTMWGDANSIASTLKIVSDADAPANARINAIHAVMETKVAAPQQTLLKVIAAHNQDRVSTEALHALGTLGGNGVAAAIVGDWKGFSPAARQAAADVLVSRRSWAGEFLNAVKDKIIGPEEVSASVFRTLARYKDPMLDERSARLLGRFHESSPNKLKLIAEKKKMVLSGAPDLSKGKEIATRTCLVCHKFYGQGADVGPDLTGVGRSSLDALLANVIDPNQVVGKGYENVEVETKDGRAISGRMVENSASHVKIISAGPKEDVIARSDIASIRVSKLSVMPEGLEQMPDADFRDLIWYIFNPEGKR